MAKLETYNEIINVELEEVRMHGVDYSFYFLKELVEQIKEREEKKYPWVKHNSHYESGGKKYYAEWEQREDSIRNHVVYELVDTNIRIPESDDNWDDYLIPIPSKIPPIPKDEKIAPMKFCCKPKHRRWIGKRPLPLRNREFGRNVSRIHVHVYKVEGKMFETDFVDGSMSMAEAKDIAIETVKREPINKPVKSDCEYIAVSFRVSDK